MEDFTIKKIEKEKWIIDTDPGCDDMVANFYMLNRNDIDIKMISTVEGNTNIENVCKNIKKIIKITKRFDIPIFLGGLPILKGCPNATFVHMADGLGDIEDIINVDCSDIHIERKNSSLKMVEIIEKYPGQINILMIGPLTNLAIAYMINPEITNLIKSIYIMGGSIKSTGNILPCSEFNFAYDFIAPGIILNFFKNIILVPWDTTESHHIKSSDILNLKEYFCVNKMIYNEKTFLYFEKLVEKISHLKGYMVINDFYCSLAIFNYKLIQNCSVVKLNCIVDSEIWRGGLTVKSFKKFGNKFEIACKYLDKIGTILVVDKIDNIIIKSELKNIFL